jgi:1,4-alpha-glucan branching enzyme
LKAVHLTDRYIPAIGGVESHIFNLCKALNQKGIETEVVTSDIYSVNPLLYVSRPKDSMPVKTKRGFRILPLPQGLGLVSPGMLNELNGDIIHAHGLGRFPTFLWWVSKSKRKPFVITTHSDAGRQRLSKRIFDSIIPRLTIHNADAIIALSRHEKNYLLRLGVEENRITVIPNGVDLNEMEKFRKNAMHLPGTVVFAGRMDIQHKGLDILLQALSILVHRRHIKAKLYLAGPEVDSSYSKLCRLAQQYDVFSDMVILGALKRDSLLKLISGATLLVLPSRIEPFGIVILEAMALGTPVVAAAVGAIPEVLGGGRLGILVKPEDPYSLADGMQEILLDSNKFRQYSENALEGVKAYSWDKIAEMTLLLYKSILCR